MKNKDFSQIVDLINTNGVGFVKCFFRSSLYPEDILDANMEEKDWRIDFSNGINYLGSLHLKAGKADEVSTDQKNEKKISESTIYLGKVDGVKKEICIHLIFNSEMRLQGECLIETESTEREWE